MRRRELEDPLSVETGQRVGNHEYRVRHVAIHRVERLVEVVGLAHAQRLYADPQGPSTRLRRSVPKRHTEVVGVPQHRDATQLRSHLLENLHPLRRDFYRHIRDASEVAAGPRKALNQSREDRIACSERHYWKCCSVLGGERGGITESNDDIDFACHEFPKQARQQVHVRFGASALQRKISIERIAALSEAADERRPKGTIVGNCRAGGEQPDTIHLGRALCGDSARPYYHRAENSEESPPPHAPLLKVAGPRPNAVQKVLYSIMGSA